MPNLQVPAPTPKRARRAFEGEVAKPIYAVWEVTLRCDQPCQHCGSRAGPRREQELGTDEALLVVSNLAELGCREIVLIGGEAYLRPDIEIIIEALAQKGIRVIMQSGGRGLRAPRLRRLVDAGLAQVGISVDGLEDVHDELRGNKGSYQAALEAISLAKQAGLAVSANSQINRLNYKNLPELAQVLQAQGAKAWQLTLTVPMGRAADRPHWLLPPSRTVDVIDTLAEIQLEAARRAEPGKTIFSVAAGNTIGYFGPHEQVIRSRPGGADVVWDGCKAGFDTIGIESDGTIKSCPSLPTGPYAGGNVRQRDLKVLWGESPQLAFNRTDRNHELWGRCKDCYYASICKGGCSWMAHTTLGRRGNNPYCYHRVETLAKQGLRERLVPRYRAPDQPYDFGRFTLEEVSLDTPEHEDPVLQNIGQRHRLPVLA